jgi:hypothetical protein
MGLAASADHPGQEWRSLPSSDVRKPVRLEHARVTESHREG